MQPPAAPQFFLVVSEDGDVSRVRDLAVFFDTQPKNLPPIPTEKSVEVHSARDNRVHSVSRL